MMTTQQSPTIANDLQPGLYPRQKVLVIDDSGPIHELVRFRLKHDAVDVVSASDGATGIDISGTAMPDLILLDVDMPGMNGFEVCRRLKEDPATSHIPIMFITTESTIEQKVHGLGLGAADYVTKPFDPTELRARVNASLRGKRSHDRLISKVMVDDMTDLWNSLYIERQLAAAIREAKRRVWPLSCIVLDVDGLSAINDRYRPDGGDAVLRALAERIWAACRAEDIAGRLAGGTFAILSKNTGQSQAARFAQRLLNNLASRSVTFREASINFKCSFGIGSVESEEICNPLEDAREALRRAKAFGGGRIAVLPQTGSETMSMAITAPQAGVRMRTSLGGGDELARSGA
jgi:diguanylate cyclase (GGDEF)-like protein